MIESKTSGWVSYPTSKPNSFWLNNLFLVAIKLFIAMLFGHSKNAYKCTLDPLKVVFPYITQVK